MRLIKRKSIRGKTFFKWLLSFAVILILPLVIGSFFYIQSLETIRREVERVNEGSLEQVKILIDGKLEEINKVCTSISLDNKTQSLIFAHDQLAPEDYYTKSLLQKDIAKFITSNSFIEDIYLYLPQSSAVVTRNLLIDMDRDQSEVDWLIGLDQITQFEQARLFVPDYRIIKSVGNKGDAADRIVYYYPLALQGSINSPEAWLIVVANPVSLQAILENNSLKQQGLVTLIDRKNSLIEFGQLESGPDLSLIDLQNLNRISYQELLGERLLVISLPSDQADWLYVSLLPTSYFLASVQYIKNLMLAYLVICLAVGSCLIYIMTKRAYHPLEHLMSLYVSKHGDRQSLGFDEFPFLENAVRDMLNEHENIHDVLNRQRPIIRQNLLTHILKGTMASEHDIREQSRQYGIDLDGASFGILLIDAEDFGQQVRSDRDIAEVLDLLAFLADNILDETLPSSCQGNVSVTDGRVVCLIVEKFIDTKSNCSKLTEQLEEISRQIVQFFASRFSIQISIAISNRYPSLVQTSKAYSEAVDVIEYKNMTNQKQMVIHVSKVSSNDAELINTDSQLDLERQFIDFFRHGDYNNAMKVIDRILAVYLSPETTSLKMVKYRMFGLINAILNLLEEIKSVVDAEFFVRLDPVERLIAADSVAELSREVKLIFREIADYFDQKELGQLSNRIRSILQYIENNYHDENLSVEAIAHEYDLDPSYLHRLFKRATGTGVLDRIHKTRVEKAKLLLSTDLSIKQIAGQVGFYNSLALIRVFKKLEGLTPGKYRENRLKAWGEEFDV